MKVSNKLSSTIPSLCAPPHWQQEFEFLITIEITNDTKSSGYNCILAIDFFLIFILNSAANGYITIEGKSKQNNKDH